MTRDEAWEKANDLFRDEHGEIDCSAWKQIRSFADMFYWGSEAMLRKKARCWKLEGTVVRTLADVEPTP